jgi:coenzyme F420-0:L-glutamate ligase/coenzyme F420-1:gamma-L-glutamate ligase
VLLLPENPTLSSDHVCKELSKKIKKNISIIISDSMTRPYRAGVINFALASTNVPSLVDITNQKDIYGNTFKCTEVAIADELASAAGLIMGQGNEQKPVIIIKGFSKQNSSEFDASNLVIPEENDLYR